MRTDPNPETAPNLLEVRGLATHFQLQEGLVRAVEAVDLDVRAGETLAIVGESGCGKSITARSILQLVDPPGKIVAGEINYRRADGTVIDIAKLDPRGKAIRELRGQEIAMVFQEPMSSLSPVHTIGAQIMENITEHEKVSKAEARDRAIEALREVGIPRPERRVDAYTFQLSGGMRQRAMIAMALACRPRLLIADEPTTALDVTIQAQILDLFRELQERHEMAVIFITHDLGVVAEVADRVAVMYLGLVVEQCDVDDLFYAPRHPYTTGLLLSMPMVGPRSKQRLATIPGSVPHPYARPTGCPYHTRCDRFLTDRCDSEFPTMISAAASNGEGRSVRCLLYETPESVIAGEGEK
jgi:peptide/nickel transport system ATP-binding protein